jgi:hypothetical protein
MDVTQNLEFEYFRSLYNESDRGCVLLVASRLEDSLKWLHSAHITATVPQSKALTDRLFAPYAPLSSFAGRIQIAHGYGLISHAVYVDVKAIRYMRNQAAHSIEDLSLTAPAMRDKIFALRSPKAIVEATPELAEGLSSGELQTIRSPGAGETGPKLHLMVCSLCIDLHIVIKATRMLETEVLRAKGRRSPSAKTEARD